MNTKKLSMHEVIEQLRSLTPEERERLEMRIGKVPEKVLKDMIDYYKELLKDTERSTGIASNEWAIAYQTLDIMIFSANVLEMKERLVQQYRDQCLLTELLQKRCSFYESELLKYTTLNDLQHKEAAAWFGEVMNKKNQNTTNEKE